MRFFPTTACILLSACGSSELSDDQRNPSVQTTSAGEPSSVGEKISHPLSDLQKMQFDISGAYLGDSFAAVKKAWMRSHSNFRVETKTDWMNGVGTFVTDLHLSSSSGDDTFEARFTSPLSGNRVFYLSHTLQDMGNGRPLNRKVTEELISKKFGNSAFKEGPNTYGGEIVGPDHALIGGCVDFEFPETVDSADAERRAHCGLTALATILSDNSSTAEAVTLQLTDFALLNQLAKHEAIEAQRNLEKTGRNALKNAVEPDPL